jgi:hypothetical protein
MNKENTFREFIQLMKIIGLELTTKGKTILSHSHKVQFLALNRSDVLVSLSLLGTICTHTHNLKPNSKS